MASVVGWGLLAGFLVRVWKEIEDDAVKTTAAKLRAMPSYAANLLGRLWDVCRGWLVAWSPGFERIYRKRVHEKYGIFNDRGLGLINANRLDLEKVYVELSIHSDVTFKTPPVDPLRRPVEGREPVWRFLRELRPGYALVLLGAPGSGKTTLLHHLLLTYARGRQWRFRVCRRVPAFLEFRSLAALITGNPDFSLTDAFRDQIKVHFADLEKDLPAGWVDRRLRQGRMILLFDGLDEVASPEARRAVSAWLERHLTAEASRANLFLATSRPSGYQDAALERARVLQVEPFSPEQSRRFIQCWYLQNEIVSSGLKETDAVRRRAQEEAEDLLRRLGENPNLYDLSVNPLLLTMLCMVHRYHGALPGSRSQLYAEICQVLLERWRQAHGVTDADGLRGEQKLSVLRPLAEAYMLAGRRELEERENPASHRAGSTSGRLHEGTTLLPARHPVGKRPVTGKGGRRVGLGSQDLSGIPHGRILASAPRGSARLAEVRGRRVVA
ncbi:MAG: NACHT domain-containing protein [Actinomycetota bacterium]